MWCPKYRYCRLGEKYSSQKLSKEFKTGKLEFHSVWSLLETAKVWCVFLMADVAMLSHAEIGRNDHREDASYFISIAFFQQTFVVESDSNIF